ncbi:aladin [Nymphaea colorata]|nr:aladin [Nymphaea colorata]
MPSFPPPGSLTVCEIRREMVVADSLSDSHAKDAYGKLLGTVFSPIPFEPNALLVNTDIPYDDGNRDVVPSSDGLGGVKGSLLKCLSAITRITREPVKLQSKISVHAISWHQHKHILAFISGPNQVSVHDFDDLDCRDPCILSSESQRGVQMLDWRPNGGRTLAVACKGGVCIWSASYPGNSASLRSGSASFLVTPARGSGIRWAMVDFLRSPNGETVTSLSWSPNGRNLVSASSESSSFIIWDIAQGTGTPIRRGFGAISMLKWSPTGDYFFSAKFDGTFYLWETSTWTSETWSSSGEPVQGAVWGPDGRSLLLAFSKSPTLGSVHFASRPPLLDAHLLPVDLPELASMGASVEMIAWDASGERLAVSFTGNDDNYDGLIAVYDTRRTPLISSSFIGFIRGPGERPKALAFSFHNNLKQGPLLSVSWSSGWCCTYPLIFR